MITKYIKFNEGLDDNVKPFDRVITHGNIRGWEDDYPINIDINGQTGVVHEIQGDYLCAIVFDNYFAPCLDDLNKKIKINRGYWIDKKRLEKMKLPQHGEILKMVFSDQLTTVLEYSEYITAPIYADINYIDITDKNDTISYLSNQRIDRLQKDDNVWNNNLRQNMKIGRFIKIINPYTNEISLNKKIDLYKSAYNAIILKKYKLEIVKGEDILKWYSSSHNQEGAGSLNRSCMLNQQERLNLYADNPDKISMLIMLNDDNKLIGRALIWKVDKPALIYMDRIYTLYQEDVNVFTQYAKSRKWRYYEKDLIKRMVVYLGNDYGHPDNNPYMDTFQIFYLYGEEGEYYLTNNRENREEDPDFDDDYDETENCYIYDQA